MRVWYMEEHIEEVSMEICQLSTKLPDKWIVEEIKFVTHEFKIRRGLGSQDI